MAWMCQAWCAVHQHLTLDKADGADLVLEHTSCDSSFLQEEETPKGVKSVSSSCWCGTSNKSCESRERACCWSILWHCNPGIKPEASVLVYCRSVLGLAEKGQAKGPAKQSGRKEKKSLAQLPDCFCQQLSCFSNPCQGGDEQWEC